MIVGGGGYDKWRGLEERVGDEVEEEKEEGFNFVGDEKELVEVVLCDPSTLKFVPSDSDHFSPPSFQFMLLFMLLIVALS